MRRFIECLIPLTQCNIKCSYCYVVQEGRRSNSRAEFKFPVEVIVRGLSKSRLGGVSLISITASGETLITPELPDIVAGLLKEGHFVNITTNGLLSGRVDALLSAIKGYESHMHVSFSFHYTEVVRRNQTEVFFQNINKVRSAGCSILLQFNLVDEYLPYLDEIKNLAEKNVGAMPQVALTRDESGNKWKIMSSLSPDEYFAAGKMFDSPLFELTNRMFNKRRTEYCYAGYWSAKLNLCTGEMTGCYGLGVHQNIFEDLSKPMIWRPVGCHCGHRYCFNASHFISQGIIPSLCKDVLTYGELRNREAAGWYSAEMKEFLYGRFEDTNPLLSVPRKAYYEMLYAFGAIGRRLGHYGRKIVKILSRR